MKVHKMEKIIKRLDKIESDIIELQRNKLHLEILLDEIKGSIDLHLKK